MTTDEQRMKQRQHVKTYEDAHDRITCMFPKGTKDRINRLELGCSPSRFAMFATEFMLNYCEKHAGNLVYTTTDSIQLKKEGDN